MENRNWPQNLLEVQQMIGDGFQWDSNAGLLGQRSWVIFQSNPGPPPLLALSCLIICWSHLKLMLSALQCRYTGIFSILPSGQRLPWACGCSAKGHDKTSISDQLWMTILAGIILGICPGFSSPEDRSVSSNLTQSFSNEMCSFAVWNKIWQIRKLLSYFPLKLSGRTEFLSLSNVVLTLQIALFCSMGHCGNAHFSDQVVLTPANLSWVKFD